MLSISRYVYYDKLCKFDPPKLIYALSFRIKITVFLQHNIQVRFNNSAWWYSGRFNRYYIGPG